MRAWISQPPRWLEVVSLKQPDFAGDAVNGQLARNGQFFIPSPAYARRFKGQGRERRYVKKISALQMCITLRIAGVD